MANDIAKPTEDLFVTLAAEAPEEMGPRLKFTKDGGYQLDGADVALGSEFVAVMSEIAQGWAKFQGKKLVDELRFKLKDGVRICDRAALGDLNQRNWEIERSSGIAKDPWGRPRWLLPLQSINDENLICTFITDSITGSMTVTSLLKAYTGAPQRHAGALPIIQIGSRSYENEYGKQHAPIFRIVRWTEPTVQLDQLPLATPVPAVDVNARKLAQIAATQPPVEPVEKNADMGGDDIPF